MSVMLDIYFSIIIPVYNRPDEVDALLESLTQQSFSGDFEVVIVEDGSTVPCETTVKKHQNNLQIQYFKKPNSGAGLSRNFGMQKASGNYFVILDSDVLLPAQYLQVVHERLSKNYTDAYGGPDAAHKDFNPLQKAINYSMTSFLTTGGLRGGKEQFGKFQLRSFNMGISRKAFQKTGGFSKRKTGEDIALSFELWKAGFSTQLIQEAYVYHKRRTNITDFFVQTYRFGKERPKLNREFHHSGKLTFWFPSLFVLGSIFAGLLLFFSQVIPALLLAFYLCAILLDAAIKNRSLRVGFLSILTTITQFYAYGTGFLISVFSKN